MSPTPDPRPAVPPTPSSSDDPRGPGGHAGEVHDAGAPEEIHLPPNSWVPISVALSLAVLFVGLLQVRPFNLVICLGGGVWLVLSLVGWYTAARTEYHELH